MIRIVLVLACALFCANIGFGQQLTDEQKKMVDSLTAHWNAEGKPGGALAILKKGRLMAYRTAGLADIDAHEKIALKTPFQLAQLSDSFVSFALLQLHFEGKLSLEHSVNKYVPQLKNMPENLKVKHLLQQSSGIHDFEILKNIAGWGDTKAFSTEDALSLLSTQKTLSFEPGSQFAHSRSNMLLASEIIANATKQPFKSYMEKSVFTPLRMSNSHVLSTDNQNKNGFAKSYRIEEDDNVVLVPSKRETYAGVNIVASIEDLVKWERNLMSPSPETAETVEFFNRFVQLEDGSYYSVPRGKLTYGQKYIHKERGINTAMSTGGIDGFAAAIFNFPSEELTVITLSNNGEPYNGYIGMISAHAILGDVFLEPISIDFENLKSVPLDTNYHKKCEGTYWDAVGEISRELRIENDTLRYVRTGSSSALIPLSQDKFQMMTEFDDKIVLSFSEENGQIQMRFAYGEATPFLFEKYMVPVFGKKELHDRFSGNYFCEALNVSYTVKGEEKSLSVSADSVKMTFVPTVKNTFRGDQWYMRSIEFEFDKEGKATGFYVKNDAIRNLWFEKRTDG